MPRDGSGVYSKPLGTTASPNTTIESAKFNSVVDDLVTDANAARPLTSGGTGATSASAARVALGVDVAQAYAVKTGNYTAVAADNNAFHNFTGATPTLSLTAAATLGANWHYDGYASGGPVIIDPNGAELINGAATVTIPQYCSFSIKCDASAFVCVVVTSSSSADLVPVGTSIMYNGRTAPTGYLKENGAAYSRTTYAALFTEITASSTVSISIASPGVVTWNAHGLIANDPVRFSTTGALPTGITANTTTYYVVGASITTNTFQVSATAGGAAINTSGTQTGVHTALFAPFGYGDGTTTFNVPDSRAEFVRGWDDGRGVDTGRNFGSAQSDEFKSHTHQQALGGALSNITPGPGSYVIGNANNSNVTNAGGTETRPRNTTKLYCIKY